MLPHVETIAIGDEILSGKISDTNSTFVAESLLKRGLKLSRQTVVADDIPIIQQALEESAARAVAVVVFGGLGPTSDDKTAEAVAGLLGGGLAVDASSKERLVTFFEARRREVTENALKQVRYPARALALPNTRGLAPGFSCRLEQSELYFLPGVPHEMRAMFLASVLPSILATGKGMGTLVTHTWKCLGIAESELQGLMDPVEAALPAGAWLGYRTRFPENHLTLYLPAGGTEALASVKDRIGRALRRWCYTEEDKELEQLVLEGLARRGWKLALAESCTGGLVAQRLTRVAGASDHFWGSFVSYRVEAKKAMLGVDVPSPQAAVSADTSRRLAEGAKRVSGCQVGAAITGYMGPGPGTEKDPVGTIYLSVVGEKEVERRIVQPHWDRETAQWGAATRLLNEIRSVLEE